MFLAEPQDDVPDNGTDDNDDVDPIPDPTPNPTPDDGKDGKDGKHMSQAHTYFYMGSVLLILSKFWVT